ncbi:hypothetical protein BKA70DRAFT_20837 [Coprinopsis sp. MPI-PUGE-AT-0042]|nr:hypothetical protein BKA70DRAFT_20837 [Coprinopsis sp. MPI-PUGE-AT-0042]
MQGSSPLTSSESMGDSPNVIKRSGGRKRRMITSDDDEEQPVASSSGRRRLTNSRSMDYDEDMANLRASYEEHLDIDVELDDVPPESQSQQTQSSDRPAKKNRTGKGASKGKEKTSRRGSQSKRPKAKGSKKVDDNFGDASEDEEFEGDFDEDEEEEMQALSEEDDYSDEEQYGRKGSGKGKSSSTSKSGRAGKGSRGHKSEEPTFSFRNEGKLAAQAQAGSAAKASKPDHLNFDDDMDVDVTGEGSQPLEAAPSSARGGSSPPSGHALLGKEEQPKKRKLPTIKKNKTSGVMDSTPAKASATKEGAEVGTKSVLDEVGASSSTRKPAARVGVADLDLMNKNIYDQLFKGGGSSLKSEREAKEAQRKRELNTMKEEWKAKKAAEDRGTPPFDLQSQNDKISRFEERLRASQSGALYPHYMAGKWREHYERSRARERTALEPQHPVNGHHGGERRV